MKNIQYRWKFLLFKKISIKKMHTEAEKFPFFISDGPVLSTLAYHQSLPKKDITGD